VTITNLRPSFFESEVQKWIANDRQNYQDWRYSESIKNYNWMIEELHKMYDIADPFMRLRICSALKQSKKELTKIQADYEKFKRAQLK
jgi:hypothetical protein